MQLPMGSESETGSDESPLGPRRASRMVCDTAILRS
jgi:hypothetical protein